MSKNKVDRLYGEIACFIDECRAESDLITDGRKRELSKLADYVRDSLRDKNIAKLTFICTHNSRRSHLSQIWAKVTAEAIGISAVQTFSGGTESTAMNPRVVDSLRRSGFRIDAVNPELDNPRYQVRFSDELEPLECFSKVFDQSPNPKAGYCAVMTCSSADEACPIVPGCDLRLPIRYEDPKVADDTPEEAAVYDERSRQICREMLYAMMQV